MLAVIHVGPGLEVGQARFLQLGVVLAPKVVLLAHVVFRLNGVVRRVVRILFIVFLNVLYHIIISLLVSVRKNMVEGYGLLL